MLLPRLVAAAYDQYASLLDFVAPRPALFCRSVYASIYVAMYRFITKTTETASIRDWPIRMTRSQRARA